MVAVTAIMVGAVSLWVSARARSMQGAVLGAYVWTVVIVVGAMGLLVAEFFLLEPDDLGQERIVSGLQRNEGRELYSTWINPVVGMVDASAEATDFRTEIVTSPYRVFQGPLVARQGFDPSDLSRLSLPQFDNFDRFLDFGGSPVITTNRLAEVAPLRGAVWPRSLLFQAIATVVALWAAQRIIHVPRTSLRRRREETANAT